MGGDDVVLAAMADVHPSSRMWGRGGCTFAYDMVQGAWLAGVVAVPDDITGNCSAWLKC